MMRVFFLLISLILTSDANAQRWWADPPRKTIVAVMQYGLDCSQFDTVPGWNFVDNNNDPCTPINPHGTDTTNILVDLVDDVQIMPLEVLDPVLGISNEADLIAAIEFAVANGADIIEAIILISGAWNIPDYDQPGQFQGLCDAIANSGLLFIAVTGNEGIHLNQVPGSYRYPPACNAPNMIVVQASTQADQPTGSFPGDILAPGENINGLNGASYAAPQVTATAVREHQARFERTSWQELRQLTLTHVNVATGILDTFYPWRPTLTPPPPPPPPSACVRDGTVINACYEINANNFNDLNPIESKQGNGQGTGARGYMVGIPSSGAPNLMIEIYPDGVTRQEFRGSQALLSNTEYLAEITHDGTTLRFRVDGVLDGEWVTAPPLPNSELLRECEYFWSSSWHKFFNGSCVVQ